MIADCQLSTGHRALRAYFRSGWAFLIPYLAAYLLYAWLRWPVNPGGAGEGIVKGVRERESLASSDWSLVPSLLHVYWALHAAHLVLGVIALRSWWKGLAPDKAEWRKENGSPPASGLQPPASAAASGLRPPASGLRPLSSVLWPLLPWFCLALIFWIPGVYLEFPADPWQHYARVNEWSWLQTVTEHSYWKKSSYFLAYSLIGQITPPILQLKWFDVYYTGCCLLLCWQYYRLAQATGIGENAAMIFIMLQAVVFGNFIFGFYRYYGMSSTIFAQLAAVALIRWTLETVQQKKDWGVTARQSHFPPLPHGAFFWQCACVSGFLALIAFNHIQGLGICALGVAGVIMWRLVSWKPKLVPLLILFACGLSLAALLWYPRHPMLTALRESGWLTAWYGFSLFEPSNIKLGAYDRAMGIIGVVGLFNIGAGLWLLYRNSVVGWLTMIPPLLLSTPFVAIPFSNALIAHHPSETLATFSRMLLAVPNGLALVALLASRFSPQDLRPLANRRPEMAGLPCVRTRVPTRPRFIPVYMYAALLGATTLPASGPFYNRLFGAIAPLPDDLAMKHVLVAASSDKLRLLAPFVSLDSPDVAARLESIPAVLTTPGIAYVLHATGTMYLPGVSKITNSSPAATAESRLESLSYFNPGQVQLLRANPLEQLYSSYSLAGFISGHWRANAVALDHATQTELSKARVSTRKDASPPQLWLELLMQGGTAHYYGSGAGEPPKTFHEPRGVLNELPRFVTPHARECITLRPVLRTFRGNAWRLTLAISGPGSYRKVYEHKMQPNRFGLPEWHFPDFDFNPPREGRYTIEIGANTAWPAESFGVVYWLDVGS